MQTQHHLHIRDARDLDCIDNGQVQLVLTSPPYPMVEMWDEAFRGMSDEAGNALDESRGMAAFEAMHQELDRVWAECFRVLSPSGFACINIGDATRTVDGDFRLYHNHARIVSAMVGLGFTVLPDILWRKPTNAPNKFMGSGMLPAGAYVTYEHEYVLVFRKGGKRVFRSAEDKARRSRSAFFWEERNQWFSDVWSNLPGAGQLLEDNTARERSAAFPFEIPYRLIQMYSAYGDTVLDPFVGTGTTMAAAVVAGRSSVGVEVSAAMGETVGKRLKAAVETGEERILGRLAAHRQFVETRVAQGKVIKHHNAHYDFPVMTSQETTLELVCPVAIEQEGAAFQVRHASA